MPLLATNLITSKPTRSNSREIDSANLAGGNHKGHMVKFIFMGSEKELVSA